MDANPRWYIRQLSRANGSIAYLGPGSHTHDRYALKHIVAQAFLRQGEGNARLSAPLPRLLAEWHALLMKSESMTLQVDNEAEHCRVVEEALIATEAQKNKVFAWLCGSVVAFTTGGLLASISLVDKISHPGWIIFAFVASLLAMCVTALIHVWSLSSIWDDQDAWLDQMKTPLHLRAAEVYNDALNKAANSRLRHKREVFAGLVSCFLAMVAFASLGLTLNLHDELNAQRCLDVQKRMFAAQPDRNDLPDLFQALGCHPQGEGSVKAPLLPRER